MTYSRIATYPLAQYVPPIHHKGLAQYEVAQLTHHAQERFVSACNEALDPLGMIMDTGGAVWGVTPDEPKKHRDIVEEVADSLDYEDIFDVATEWRVRNHKRALLDPKDVCQMDCCENLPVQVMDRKDY